MDLLVLGDQALGSDCFNAVEKIVLYDDALASEFSTIYRTSEPISLKLIGTTTSPALATAA
jgi:hypothetical protein